ncbi:hypothetical protein Tco_0630132 [Tanacetum coccineum]
MLTMGSVIVKLVQKGGYPSKTAINASGREQVEGHKPTTLEAAKNFSRMKMDLVRAKIEANAELSKSVLGRMALQGEMTLQRKMLTLVITRDVFTELYRIVMNRYSMNRPEDELEKVLWKYLKNMFEAPLSTDPIWSLLDIYMLTERKYPLTAEVCKAMLDKNAFKGGKQMRIVQIFENDGEAGLALDLQRLKALLCHGVPMHSDREQIYVVVDEVQHRCQKLMWPIKVGAVRSTERDSLTGSNKSLLIADDPWVGGLNMCAKGNSVRVCKRYHEDDNTGLTDQQTRLTSA